MIAGFIFLRLRGILGKRTGFDGKAPPQFKEVLKNIFTYTNKLHDYNDILLEMKSKNTTGEINCQFMDYEKAYEYFGWSPQHSFNDGMLKTIDWYKKYLTDR